jgi:hypothetical protein
VKARKVLGVDADDRGVLAADLHGAGVETATPVTSAGPAARATCSG